ncbi:DUF805 domain-containing protein [Pseudonocardia sp.]|uniref:DUF805 domain-containing protein n=1 Tax=Pseudonocardia sp. TaxID=60912 RepID=UPI0039C9F967
MGAVVKWYLKVLRQYVDFNGRARRKEYWIFTLFNVIVSIVLAALDRSLGLRASGFGLLSGLYGLAGSPRAAATPTALRPPDSWVPQNRMRSPDRACRPSARPTRKPVRPRTGRRRWRRRGGSRSPADRRTRPSSSRLDHRSGRRRERSRRRRRP